MVPSLDSIVHSAFAALGCIAKGYIFRSILAWITLRQFLCTKKNLIVAFLTVKGSQRGMDGVPQVEHLGCYLLLVWNSKNTHRKYIHKVTIDSLLLGMNTTFFRRKVVRYDYYWLNLLIGLVHNMPWYASK